MDITRLDDCTEIIANDGCRLRELLHPERGAPLVNYSLAWAWVDAGERTLRHTLRQGTEVYVIVQGQGRMHIGDEAEDVREGDTIVIPADSEQWIENTGSGVLGFLALVNPPWQAEDDVLLEG